MRCGRPTTSCTASRWPTSSSPRASRVSISRRRTPTWRPRRSSCPGRENRDALIGNAIASLGDAYPYVILDCPPSLGLLTVNALAAANRLIVPVQCEYYALEGLAQLLESVERIRGAINPGLALTGLLLTMYDRRTRLSGDVEREVRTHFGPKVFSSVVPRSVRLAEAPSHGLPITQYDPNSRSADAYYRLALEVVERG